MCDGELVLLGRHPRRGVLAALCATTITSYGVLYYAFPVLAGTVTRDTGWPTTTLAAAFSTGQVVSALAGIPLGHVLDRHGPRLVMTGASVLGTGALVAIAFAPTLPLYFVAWAVAGVAMAGLFYGPAFAALTRWFGEDRVPALTALTLVAGLSSTI